MCKYTFKIQMYEHSEWLTIQAESLLHATMQVNGKVEFEPFAYIRTTNPNWD